MQYLAAFPNKGKNGPVAQLFTESEHEIGAFKLKHDQPGFAVYRCVSPLRPGSTKRNLSTVAALAQFVVDIDFRSLRATPAEIDSRLRTLPLTPTEVRNSGAGRHVRWKLREPISADDAAGFGRAVVLLKRLTARLSGDPAVAHGAALLREVGTFNSKYEPPVKVEVLWGTGSPVDLGELFDLCSLLPDGGMFSAKAQGSESPIGEAVDVDALLKAMRDGNVHDTQLRCSAAMLSRGEPVDEVVEILLKRTREIAPEAWEWDLERTDIRRMCLDWVCKHLELADTLPDKLRSDFKAKLDAGRSPRFLYRADLDNGQDWAGWQVKARQGSTEKEKKPSGWSYYDTTAPEPIRWCVKRLIPETGVGILSGQWGSFKTTAALDISVSVMTGEEVAGRYRVKRKGAILYLASEGSATLQQRLTNIAAARGAPGQLPFAWRNDCPPLTDKGCADTLIQYIDEAQAHFERTYGLPVVLLWLDTWATSAGLKGSQDNDTFATAEAIKTLKDVADATGTFLMAIDHFGKVLEAGTRGSSNKECSTDTVLSTLADKEINGSISNTRLSVRKQRDGISGFEVQFAPTVVENGFDADGDPATAITLSWGEEQQAFYGGHRRATIWAADTSVTPMHVTVASVVNSTATTPNYSIWVSNDDTAKVVTASSSSGTVFFNASTGFASSVTWFSSLGTTNSSNSMITLTAPFRFLTLVASAGSTAQSIVATIVQAG